MPSNLLLLPFLGGFGFISSFIYYNMAVAKLNGQRLIIWAALAGLGLVAMARPLVVAINHYFPTVGYFWQTNIFPGAFSGTAVLAFFLGLVLPYFLNKISDFEKAFGRSLDKYGNSLEKLLYKSMIENLQIQLTLADGKGRCTLVT